MKGEGKIILITGASSGIGLVTAKRLISEGHVVYCAARHVTPMKELEELGGIAIKLDVTDHPSLSRVVSRIIKEKGRIDVLVNNAGFGLYGAVEDVSMDEARYQFEVNIFGLARLTQLVLPHMRKKKSGTIINTSSMGGKMYTPFGAWYHATKYALEGWSDCLRLEVAQFGINVVIVEPGIIQTPFGDTLMDKMVKSSGKGAYKEFGLSVARGVKETYKSGGGSSPDVIADAISRAVASKRPKTRYVAGKYARILIFLRYWLGDRLFDRLVLGQMK